LEIINPSICPELLGLLPPHAPPFPGHSFLDSWQQVRRDEEVLRTSWRRKWAPSRMENWQNDNGEAVQMGKKHRVGWQVASAAAEAKTIR
jgi:hypothetical protein